jgi:hypothetical protein
MTQFSVPENAGRDTCDLALFNITPEACGQAFEPVLVKSIAVYNNTVIQTLAPYPQKLRPVRKQPAKPGLKVV